MINLNQVISYICKYDHAINKEDMDSDLTNLKLQKLLYYTQGHFLAEFKKRLFKDEFVAWAHGPVIPSVYHVFKDCAANVIEDKVLNNDLYDSSKLTNDLELVNFFARLMTYYNQFSPWKLRDMTHEEDPWKNTKAKEIIKIELIKDFFSNPVIKNRISVSV